jgi:hypothetical protein
MIEKDLLFEINKEYNFTIKKIGMYIEIKSNNDIWYIKNLPFDANCKIKLLHCNNYGRKYRFHTQGVFDNYHQVFMYIKNHDNKYYIMKKGGEKTYVN